MNCALELFFVSLVETKIVLRYTKRVPKNGKISRCTFMLSQNVAEHVSNKVLLISLSDTCEFLHEDISQG